MSHAAKHIIFTGRVQGVGFRFTIFRIANQHQLTGVVRNLPDGTVEMIAQGAPDNIENCLEEIKEGFGGYIRESRVTQIPIDPRYKEFKITF